MGRLTPPPAWSLLVVALFGCQRDADRGMRIREGVSLVFEGPAVSDPDCEWRQTESGVCPTWTDLIVQDVARDGERVVVLLYTAQPGSVGVVLAESPDLGATWTSRFLGSPPTANTIFPGLSLEADTTLIHWVTQVDGRPVGQLWVVPPGFEGAPVTVGTSMIAQVNLRNSYGAHGYLGPVDFADVYSGFLDVTWAPGASDATHNVRCAGYEQCTTPEWIPTPDGEWVGAFDVYRGAVGGAQVAKVCTYNAALPFIDCVDWEAWPAKDMNLLQRPSGVAVRDPDGVRGARAYTQGGHAWAQRLHPSRAGTLVPAVDLGPGRPATWQDPNLFVGSRPRFSAFTAVVNEEGNRLYRLRGVGGLDRVVFPDAPCDRLDRCGEIPPAAGIGQATFLLPLDGDEHLVFYVADSFPFSWQNHQWLYVSRETVIFEEVAPESRDPEVLYPDFREASPLERMCARAQACNPSAIPYVEQCTNWWAQTSSAWPGSQAAQAAFLATPPGCAGFDTTWPELSVASAEGCRADSCTCISDGAGLPVCAEDAPCGVDCTRRGGRCQGGRCNLSADPSECDACTPDGRAVSCYTDGLTPDLKVGFVIDCGELPCEDCADGTCGPHCADDLTCPFEGQRCEDGALVQCYSHGVSARWDCAATGLACQPEGTCTPPSDASCFPAGPGCVGDDLFVCGGASSQWVRYDCDALGFDGCDASAGICR